MDEKPLIERLAELLRVPERWMIMDEEGNTHELNSGVKGITVMGSSKKEIYNLYFGKEDLSEVQLIMLDEIHTALMQFIWDNFSEEIKAENREILKPLIKKYELEGIFPPA
jgi:hypothetical protein